jgi:hypothetical protein
MQSGRVWCCAENVAAEAKQSAKPIPSTAILMRLLWAVALAAVTLPKVSLKPWPRRSCSVAGRRIHYRT